MLNLTTWIAGLLFFGLVMASLYFSRSSAPVNHLYIAVALDLAAALTQVIAFVVAVVSDAYSWVSVVISAGVGVFCLVTAEFTWARAARMEAGR